MANRGGRLRLRSHQSIHLAIPDMPSLILISEDYPRQVFQLGRATLMVGRDDNSSIRVDDDCVSRNHASIVLDGENYIVRDNGSANGTFVNGERVNRHVLRQHDIIRFGSCLFLVDMQEGRRGPTGTRAITVTHTGSKEGNVVEISSQSSTPGTPSNPIKLILSTKAPRKKVHPLPPMTVR